MEPRRALRRRPVRCRHHQRRTASTPMLGTSRAVWRATAGRPIRSRSCRGQHLRWPHCRRGGGTVRGAAVADLAAARRALFVEDAGARPRGPAARRSIASRHGAGDAGRQQPTPLHHRLRSARQPHHSPDLRAHAAALGSPVFKGSAAQVADEMEDWWRSQGRRRLHHHGRPSSRAACANSSTWSVPELQRRGIFRREYETTTLRGISVLSDAPSQWHLEQAAGERGAA